MNSDKANQSSPVRSSQTGPHARLESIVKRHLEIPWRGVVRQHTATAFKQINQWVSQEQGRPLVLDSGCGTGESTELMAARHPDCLVIGIDQSASRLARTGASAFPCRKDNVIWVRAELAGFWKLAFDSGWRLAHHYLLYPNPWPKPSQLRRRWHGHPVFPSLLKLQGRLELRSNWKIYVDEFAAAIGCINGQELLAHELEPNAISTPFERKYRNSGLPLFQLTTEL